MYKTVLKPELISECARRGLEYNKLTAPALRTCLEDDDDKKAHDLGNATAAEEGSTAAAESINAADEDDGAVEEGSTAAGVNINATDEDDGEDDGDMSDGGSSIFTSSSEEDEGDPSTITGKSKKAIQRKKRTAEAKAENSAEWQGGKPREKDDVLQGPLPNEGASFASRDACELLAGEIFESTGALSSVTKHGGVKNATNLTVSCASGCKAVISFSFTGGGIGWLLTKMVKCSCPAPAAVTTANGSTAIPSAALLEIVKPLIKEKAKVNSCILVACLTPYLFRPPNPSLVQRLRNASKLAIFGDPLTELRALPAYLAALTDLGYECKMNYLDEGAMRQRLLVINHGNYNFEEKKKPREERTRWNRSAAEAEIAAMGGVPEGAVFVQSVEVSLPTSIAILPKASPSTASDFAHGTDPKVGMVVGSRSLLTANRNILAHTLLFAIGNEDEDAWDKLNDAFIKSSPTSDRPRTYDFSDADKGAKASFSKKFKHTTQVLDLLHRQQTILKTPSSNGGGAEGKGWYMRAFYASTPAKLEAIKNDMPPQTASLLAQHSDVDQYPVASGGTYGIHGSSTAESLNKAMLFERSLHIAAAVKFFLKSEHGRFTRAKDLAMKCTNLLPPTIAEQQNGVALSASRISGVVFMDSARDVALVPLLGDKGRTAKVTLSEVKNMNDTACDVGCMVVSGLPCMHIHAAACAKGVGIVELMDPRSTTAGWQRQFKDVEFHLPSAADIGAKSHLVNSKICLAPALKRPKGRPKNSRRFQGFMERASKKKKAAHTGGVPPWGLAGGAAGVATGGAAGGAAEGAAAPPTGAAPTGGA